MPCIVSQYSSLRTLLIANTHCPRVQNNQASQYRRKLCERGGEWGFGLIAESLFVAGSSHRLICAIVRWANSRVFTKDRSNMEKSGGIALTRLRSSEPIRRACWAPDTNCLFTRAFETSRHLVAPLTHKSTKVFCRLDGCVADT